MRSTRFRFWWQLAALAVSKPRLLYDYMTTLGVGEHFFHYRHVVKEQLLCQLEALRAQKPAQEALAVAE